jgi:16S rRNA (cytosine967-C5)-methyltransferase
VLREPFDVHGSPQFGAGQLMPQSRASMHVARSVAPAPGERILDLCAAPGGKTTHLAALAADRAEIVAVERHAGRARALIDTCVRMGATSVDVRTADAVTFSGPERFDAALVDPPCSGLGTLRSRPDLRWHMLPKLIDELAALQARILDAAAAVLAPGGRLVYSVCTLTRAEGEDQVEAFLTRHPDFLASAPALTLRPDLDGTDGFFVARLQRQAARGAG